MKTENEMNNNGQRTPAAGNGNKKTKFSDIKITDIRHSRKRKEKMVRNKDRISRLRGIINLSSAVRASLPLKRPRKTNNGSKLKIIPLGGLEQIWNEYYSFLSMKTV